MTSGDDRQRLAAQLRDSEDRLRSTLEAAGVGTWEWNIRDNRVRWSPNIERIFGLEQGTFAGTYEAWLALVHPDDRARISDLVAASLRSLEPYEAEFRFVRPDGTTGWQSVRGYVIADDFHRAKLLRGVVVDVTKRRAAEDALKMHAQVLENMAEGVSLSDENGIIVYTNPAEDRMFGYARGELLGRHVTVQNAYPETDNERIVAQVMDRVRTHGEWVGEWANKKKDGTPFTTRSRVSMLERDGRSHFLCVQEDVTADAAARAREQRLAASLRESEARYRSFVSQSSEGIWRIEFERPVSTELPRDAQLDAFYRYACLAECNDAMARMYGYEHAGELTDKRLGELLVREDPRNTEFLSAFIANGYRLEGAESREVDRDGRPRIFRNSLVGVVEDGHVVRAWGTQRDVTAEVEARQQAESANRAKDEFLALLGHELRNPLSPILTALELMKLRDPTAFEKERSIIDRQVKHVVRLVDDLLDISRITRGKVSLERRPVDLSDVVANAIELTSPLLEQRAHRLSVHVPRGLILEADATRLAQVFTNLLTNAAKYTPRGGDITVEAAPEGDRVRVRVRDTGVGIRPELLSKVFGLFVQERQGLDRSEGGLGLGLAIVRSLVEMHGGTVEAHSEGAGKGSTFTVLLPCRGQRSAEVPQEERPRSLQIAGRRVLVVDDNEDAAHLIADALAEWGYTVRVAHDGPAALRVAAEFAPEIALLDIGLPAMDGYELARRLRALPRLEGIKLIAVTGYGQAKDRIAAIEAGFQHHIVKPVDFAALHAALDG